jgi:hypothetical protein
MYQGPRLRNGYRLNFSRLKCNCDEHERAETIERDGRTLLPDALKLVSIGGRDRVPNCRDLANVKYSTYKYSREETLKVMERIRPNSFMHSENIVACRQGAHCYSTVTLPIAVS